MSFFGPGTLSGYTPSPSSGMEPALLQQLQAQFPGLAGLQGSQAQQPTSLAQMG